jgi:hypothetical protein
MKNGEGNVTVAKRRDRCPDLFHRSPTEAEAQRGRTCLHFFESASPTLAETLSLWQSAQIQLSPTISVPQFFFYRSIRGPHENLSEFHLIAIQLKTDFRTAPIAVKSRNSNQFKADQGEGGRPDLRTRGRTKTQKFTKRTHLQKFSFTLSINYLCRFLVIRARKTNPFCNPPLDLCYFACGAGAQRRRAVKLLNPAPKAVKSFSMEQVPPLLTAEPSPSNNNSGRHLFSLLLSFCMALFLVDAAISFADDALIVAFGLRALTVLRGLISLVAMVMAIGVYGLIGLTPMVPKRLFLPIPLFLLATMLVVFTLAIFWFQRMEQIAFVLSGCQLFLALWLVHLSRRGGKHSWPWVKEEQLGTRGFSWGNLSAFVLLNLLVVLPFIVVYLFVSSARAIDYYSEGFVALRPGGFTVQVRKYVRDDGKMIELFPMAHVASPSFYQEVSQTFPTNSVILMEGVSDEHNVLTNKITYKRMAKTLGLAEQKMTFAPSQGEAVRADVDVGQFSSNTIAFLNLMMLFHSQGMTPETLSKMTQYKPPPHFEKELFDDLLRKRNEHLLGEIKAQLETADNIMVPWGAAHMPGLAREIQKFGFRLSETKEYVVIRFR